MRSTLHVSRPSRRGIAAATLGALALIGSLFVATPAQALNDTGSGGVFVPATGRILDTQTGTGGYSTPMPSGTYRTIKVAGLAGLPDDGSVGAVSLNATVAGSSGAGTLFGRPDADSGRTTMLIYSGVRGEFTSNSATVAVGADGTIQVMTENNARLILDVQGYYTANTDGTAAGGFVPVVKRLVDTRSGAGAPKAAIAPGKSINVQITGATGIPAGASSVVVNMIAINATDSDGYLTPYATGGSKPQNALHYAPSVTTAAQAQVPLSAEGRITIANGSATANLVVDVQGYFTAVGANGAAFTPSYGRAYDSRAAGNTALAKNETRSIQIAGKAGVPVMGSGITAVTLTLIVAHGGSAGYAQAYADGASNPGATAINFQADDIRTNTVTVALGANGKIALRNIAEATNYVIDVQGWYTNPRTPTIACNAPYSAGSWVGPANDEGATCTLTAPAASTSTETLEVSVNGIPSETFVPSETSASTFTYNLSGLSGLVTMEAALTDEDGVRASSSYAFGVGDWSTDTFTPSIESGFVVSKDEVALYPIPSRTGLLPNDASVEYTLTDTTAGTTQTLQGDDAPVAPTGLVEGHSYEWSATATALTSWDRSATVHTPAYTFRTAADGEEPTTVTPSDAGTEPQVSTRAFKPNGCTLSPDRWFKANFKPACDKHDYCYVNKKHINRDTCDYRFLQDLNAICNAAYTDSRDKARCRGKASIYYAAVRTAGWAFYKGNGKNN